MLPGVPSYLGHVNGNRFLVADLRSHGPASAEQGGRISSQICQSHFVDDFIVIERSAQAWARIRIFGGDGREADFCGNGVLLVLSLLHHFSTAADSSPRETIETASGIKPILIAGDRRMCVDISPVHLVERDFFDLAFHHGVTVYGLQIAGEPHLLVSPPREFAGGDTHQHSRLETWARRIAAQVDYPGGVNVTVVKSHSERNIMVSTFERGVQRMTSSCGSAAVAVASYFSQSVEPFKQGGLIKIESPGGHHMVFGDLLTGQWWLSGKPVLLGSGTLGDFIDVI